MQRKKLSLYSKLQIQLGLLLLPKRQLFSILSVLLNNNPPTFKLLQSCFTLRFKSLIVLLAILFPKDIFQVLKCFFTGQKRSVRSTEVVMQKRTMPGKKYLSI